MRRKAELMSVSIFDPLRIGIGPSDVDGIESRPQAMDEGIQAILAQGAVAGMASPHLGSKGR